MKNALIYFLSCLAVAFSVFVSTENASAASLNYVEIPKDTIFKDESYVIKAFDKMLFVKYTDTTYYVLQAVSDEGVFHHKDSITKGSIYFGDVSQSMKTYHKTYLTKLEDGTFKVTNSLLATSGTTYKEIVKNDYPIFENEHAVTVDVDVSGNPETPEGGDVPTDTNPIPTLDNVNQIPAEMMKILMKVVPVGLIALAILLGVYTIKRVIFSFL